MKSIAFIKHGLGSISRSVSLGHRHAVSPTAPFAHSFTTTSSAAAAAAAPQPPQVNKSNNDSSSNNNSKSSDRLPQYKSTYRGNSVKPHLSAVAENPLIEKYRPTWPFAPQSKAENVVVPARTVDDSKLQFEMTATFDHGIALFYPHLKFNPADFKVKMMVDIKDLNLCDNEQLVFKALIGSKRYNVSNGMCKFSCDHFPNRIENKKYLQLILERLISESKRLALDALNHPLDKKEE